MNPKYKQTRLWSPRLAIAGLAALIAAVVDAGAASGQTERLVESAGSRTTGEPTLAFVSLRSPWMTVYDANGWILRVPVSSSQKGRETPAGILGVIQKKAEHHLNLYDNAYMPHVQRTTWSGIAFDGGHPPRKGFLAQRSYPREDGGGRFTVDGGSLWFTTAAHLPAFVGATDNTDQIVQRIQTDRDAGAAGPTGRWLAEDIRGGGVIDRLQTILEIARDGIVSGTGGCNRLAGKATIAEAKITFGPIASTKMACTPAVMNQERKFFDALRDARGWRVDSTRRKLILLDGDGSPIVVLSQM